MARCIMCRMEIMRDVAGDDPKLCKWCETVYEHGTEHEEEYGMVIEVH